ncbi:hypothetical protein Bca4012_066090 [Brassica carinata]
MASSYTLSFIPLTTVVVPRRSGSPSSSSLIPPPSLLGKKLLVTQPSRRGFISKKHRCLTSASTVFSVPTASICLKELVNGQVFKSLVASRTLKKLRIIRCLGNWDKVLQVNGDGDSSLTKIHLERLQVNDFGLSAISKCRKLETLHIVKTPECSNSGLVCVVERCRLLRKLHIDGWRTKRIGDEGLMALAKHCLLLQELVLIGVDATHASLSAIASNCKKLERLALCGSGVIGDVEMAA